MKKIIALMVTRLKHMIPRNILIKELNNEYK